MALDVKAAFQKKDLLYQEDTLFVLTLTNAGAEALTLTDPTTLHSTIALKAVHVKTGVERVYTIPKEGRRPPAPELPLPPKKSIDATLSLQWLAYLEPGEYEVTVGYAFNKGAARAESSPVRLNVAATTPRNLVIDSVQVDAPVGFWVDLGQTPPQIVRTRFDIKLGGQVRQLLKVAKGGLRTRAVPSRPPNGVWVDGHWSAWIDGGDVFAAHVDPKLGTSAPLKMALPAGDATIVHPLYTDAPSKPDVRPAGAMLLALSTPGRDGFRLVPCALAADRVTAGAPVDVAGPAPAWIASFARADKRRIVVFAQAKDNAVTLSTVPWTGGPVRKLAEVVGAFAGAGMTADVGNDLLRVSLFARLGVAEHGALERTDVELGAKDEAAAKPVGRIAAPTGDHFTEAQVRVSRGGLVCALLRDQKNLWHLYDGKAPSLLPEPLASTPYPLELAFHQDEPVLLAGAKDAGFKILGANGQPLPVHHH